MQSRTKVGTRRLSERMSTIRPVQYEAPGANRSSRNSCHLYSRHEANFVLPLIVAFPPGFLPPGGQVFHASTVSSWYVTHNSIFQQTIQCSFYDDSIQVGLHLGSPSNICLWPCSSDQRPSTNSSTVTAATPPSPESGRNRTYFLSGDSPTRIVGGGAGSFLGRPRTIPSCASHGRPFTLSRNPASCRREGSNCRIVRENTRPPGVRTMCSSDKSLLPTQTHLMNTVSPLC